MILNKRVYLLIILMCVIPLLTFAEEERLALIIGNDKYTPNSLLFPVKDAKAIKKSLENLGFEVKLETNLNRNETLLALSNFRKKILKSVEPIVFFYFAGHGFQGIQNNIRDTYILPISEKNEFAISTNEILTFLNQKSLKAGIALFDSCRTLPFEPYKNSVKYRNQYINDIKPGYVDVSMNISNMVVGFATCPGCEALDVSKNLGNAFIHSVGGNSPYADALLTWLEVSNLPVYEMLNQVGNQVKETTLGKQIPWITGNPLKNICLAGCGDSKQNLGRLYVKTVPFNAKIYFDGKFKGKSKSNDFLIVEGIEPGLHEIKAITPKASRSEKIHFKRGDSYEILLNVW